MNSREHPKTAFIFDLDGVLVHSMPLHVLAWEEYLAGLGIEVADLESRMHGKRNAELVSDLISPGLNNEQVFEHGAAKERLFREMLAREDVAKYQVEGLKEFLHRYPDVAKAVASNAEEENIEFVLDFYGLQEHFAVKVNGMQVERPKPFPDIYLKAAQELGRNASDCIVFEDSPTGLAAGVSAGMQVVGIETTAGANLAGAALTVSDFRDPKLTHWLSAAWFSSLLQSRMMFTGIEHFAIASPNPQRLADWYVATLDFEISYEYAGNFFVEAANGSLIEIIPSEGERPASALRSPGMRHIAIAVADFDAAYNRLAGQGVVFEGQPYNNQGNRIVFFADPDGNLIHLIQRETPLPSRRQAAP